jgi:hypothetical protein
VLDMASSFRICLLDQAKTFTGKYHDIFASSIKYLRVGCGT